MFSLNIFEKYILNVVVSVIIYIVICFVFRITSVNG